MQRVDGNARVWIGRHSIATLVFFYNDGGLSMLEDAALHVLLLGSQSHGFPRQVVIGWLEPSVRISRGPNMLAAQAFRESIPESLRSVHTQTQDPICKPTR